MATSRKTGEKPRPQKDRLDQFEQDANESMAEVVAMLLWKDRYRNPDLSVQVTEADLQGLQDCVNYLKVTPKVRVFRPQGVKGHPGKPAEGGRRAIPPREDIPPRPYVVVQLVDADNQAFKPIENAEDGAKQRDHHDGIRDAKRRAPGLADTLLANLAQGAYSDDQIREAAAALKQLALG